MNDQRVHIKKYITTPGVVLWPDQKEQRQVNSSVTDVFTLYVEKLEKKCLVASRTLGRDDMFVEGTCVGACLFDFLSLRDNRQILFRSFSLS